MKSRTQWLLLQDQEDGINQFEVLGEVVKLCLLAIAPMVLLSGDIHNTG